MTDSKGEFTESVRILDSIEKETGIFSNSHFILVEGQMSFNTSMFKLGQHLLTYFITRYRNTGVNPIVIEYSSQCKTKLLKCPKGMPKKGKGSYKEWCVGKALSILKERSKN